VRAAELVPPATTIESFGSTEKKTRKAVVGGQGIEIFDTEY